MCVYIYIYIYLTSSCRSLLVTRGPASASAAHMPLRGRRFGQTDTLGGERPAGWSQPHEHQSGRYRPDFGVHRVYICKFDSTIGHIEIVYFFDARVIN
jgi:hypothetical protein